MHSLAWCFPVRHSPQIWFPSALPSTGLMGSGRQLWMCYSEESDCTLVTTGPENLPLFNTTSLPCSQIPFSRESKACFTIIHRSHDGIWWWNAQNYIMLLTECLNNSKNAPSWKQENSFVFVMEKASITRGCSKKGSFRAPFLRRACSH